ncbi:MAG: BsaA family SipW-dependent biofilm matrix protein [Oscillospiraceae bacterium]|nr:BsaA family SipW-dependent biofilm matrix protein [Oscillospiraceae bacterium]
MSKAKKKTSREKRVLIAAVLIAAVTVCGSTFAWFTSKDEVTNRLTASANYGVSITEDFTPPSEWTPGQKINKDVTAVNTGNVDAYVRLAILNDLTITAAGSGASIESNATTKPDAPEGETLVEITSDKVKSLQAGGTLVLEAGAAPTTQNVNSATYSPTATGLYLFRRNVESGSEYSGYFYDQTAGKYYPLVTQPNTVYAAGTFTETPEGAFSTATGLKLATTKTTTIANTDTADAKLISATWYSSAMDAATPTATTAGKTDAKWIQLTYTAVDSNPIKLNIELDSNWASNWEFIATGTTAPNVDQKNDFGYFYYKKALAAAGTTEKLIDSVTLDSSVSQDAYESFVYDMTVALDSIQVTKTEDGKYTNDGVMTWINTAKADANTGVPTWSSTT